MGRHTPRGGYILDMKKVRTYVVPEGLSTTNVRPSSLNAPANFKLKPYVTNMLPYETTRFDTPESGHHGYSKVLDRMIRENVDFGIEPPSKP